MLLSGKLAKLRQEKRESLQEVADAVGASKAHIWELEVGKSQNPSVDLIRRLADHFRVSVAWLVGEVPFQGKDREQIAAMHRAIEDLSQPNRQIIQTIIDGMRRGSR